MSYPITDFNGTTIAPGGAYPRGNVKDAPLGTRVDTKMVQDTIQCFSKAMSMASITPNGLPDNNTNGYQYYDALRKMPSDVSVLSGTFVGDLTVEFKFNNSIIFTSVLPGGTTFDVLLSNTGAIPGHKVRIYWHSGGVGDTNIDIAVTGTQICHPVLAIVVPAGVPKVTEFEYIGYDTTNTKHIYTVNTF